MIIEIDFNLYDSCGLHPDAVQKAKAHVAKDSFKLVERLSLIIVLAEVMRCPVE